MNKMKKIDKRKWITYKKDIYYSILPNHSGLFLMAEIKPSITKEKIEFKYKLLKTVTLSEIPEEIKKEVGVNASYN